MLTCQISAYVKQLCAVMCWLGGATEAVAAAWSSSWQLKTYRILQEEAELESRRQRASTASEAAAGAPKPATAPRPATEASSKRMSEGESPGGMTKQPTAARATRRPTIDHSSAAINPDREGLG